MSCSRCAPFLAPRQTTCRSRTYGALSLIKKMYRNRKWEFLIEINLLLAWKLRCSNSGQDNDAVVFEAVALKQDQPSNTVGQKSGQQNYFMNFN